MPELDMDWIEKACAAELERVGMAPGPVPRDVTFELPGRFLNLMQDLVARVRELEAKVKEDCATAFRLGQRTMEEIESEREACAKVAESFEDLPPDANPGATAERIAREIRARGGK